MKNACDPYKNHNISQASLELLEEDGKGITIPK